jgi:hypothetical protein
MDIRPYISGYVDGEGCFTISFSPRRTLRVGWEVRPSFSVSQNGDRAEVLARMQGYFRCGSIRPDRSDRTLKFEVRRLQDLLERIIPHFEQYPLLSGKNQDFLSFAMICRQVAARKHLTAVGITQIMKLAMEMNPSGKRRFTLERINQVMVPEDIVSATSNGGST